MCHGCKDGHHLCGLAVKRLNLSEHKEPVMGDESATTMYGTCLIRVVPDKDGALGGEGGLRGLMRTYAVCIWALLVVFRRGNGEVYLGSHAYRYVGVKPR